jgi:hypothetical protein
MAKLAYVIRFKSPSVGGSVHRVRNFAEAVFYALRDTGYGSVPNMDSATDEVHVHASASRHLGAVLRTIRLELAKHNFTEEAVISRG